MVIHVPKNEKYVKRCDFLFLLQFPKFSCFQSIHYFLWLFNFFLGKLWRVEEKKRVNSYMVTVATEKQNNIMVSTIINCQKNWFSTCTSVPLAMVFVWYPFLNSILLIILLWESHKYNILEHWLQKKSTVKFSLSFIGYAHGHISCFLSSIICIVIYSYVLISKVYWGLGMKWCLETGSMLVANK